MSDTAIPTAVLGRTGLEITKLGFGTALSRKMPDSEWGQLLGAVLDSGINFVDTANDYGVRWDVPAEEQIGKHISGRRSEYYLATKCGCGPDGGDHIWTRENAVRGLEESLRRLKTDYVDIMQYHNPTVEEAEDGRPDRRAARICRTRARSAGWASRRPCPTCPIISRRAYSTRSRFPTLPSNGSTRNGLPSRQRPASGSSSGAALPRASQLGDVNERRSKKWNTFEGAGLDELLEEGESRTTLILRYTLAHPNADTNIVGTSRIGHLEENLAGIMKGPLSADTYAEMKRRLDSVGESPASTD